MLGEGGSHQHWLKDNCVIFFLLWLNKRSGHEHGRVERKMLCLPMHLSESPAADFCKLPWLYFDPLPYQITWRFSASHVARRKAWGGDNHTRENMAHSGRSWLQRLMKRQSICTSLSGDEKTETVALCTCPSHPSPTHACWEQYFLPFNHSKVQK